MIVVRYADEFVIEFAVEVYFHRARKKSPLSNNLELDRDASHIDTI
jgi:hypothetical protein